ncbi:M48 family metallopeptidase [Candidatus Micrarchaeota archaeon]|nr:M48 family metallopeptidase [Candidatus Micrarchaeota archaeon]
MKRLQIDINPSKRTVSFKIEKGKYSVPNVLQASIYFSLIFALIVFIFAFYLMYLYIDIYAFLFIVLPIGYVVLKKSEVYHEVPITKDDHPRLFRLLESISTETGVPIPNQVVLTPFDEISVSGFINKKLNIGLISLRILKEKEFRAILAHEFAHFYGYDTILGGFFAYLVRSIESTRNFFLRVLEHSPHFAITLYALLGAAVFWIYSGIFSAIFFLHSRQVEKRADFIARQIAGDNPFYHGLLEYSAYSIYFTQHGYRWIWELANQQQQFTNVYDSFNLHYLMKINSDELKKQILENEKRGIFDSHPPLRDRLSQIPHSDQREKGLFSDSIFRNIHKLEEEFTPILTKYVHQLFWSAIVADAQKREGRCRYCRQQFQYLNELLEHEATHSETKEE